MARRKRALEPEEVTALVVDDVDDDFLEDFDDSDSSGGSAYTDTESEPEIEADSQSDADEQTEADDDVQHNWQSQSAVDRSSFPFTGDSGVKLVLEDDQSPLEIFQAIFDDALLDHIVTETNKYAVKVCAEKRRKGKMKRNSRDLLWKETNKGEMYAFLGLLLLQGIVKKPSIYSYHSTNQLISTPFFGKCISRDRFALLLKYLHFTDSEDASDPTFKFKEVLDILIQRFKSSYVPKQNISIDESLLLWKGRLKWKRYIPLKRARFGIESYILAESDTGYVWDLFVYTGKQTKYDFEIEGLSDEKVKTLKKPTKIVLKLMQSLVNQGYILGVDNFYTSPELFEILLDNKTDAIGTVRSNRKLLSPVVRSKVLKKGETVVEYKHKMMHMKWRDKKYVNMLSTIYEDSMEEVAVAGQRVSKPDVCIKYRKHHMAGVDKMDQIISVQTSARKGVKKYYKKIFLRLLDIAALNCHVIYKTNGGRKCFLDFKLQLIEEIISKYGSDIYCLKKPSSDLSLGPCPARLSGRHFLVETGPHDENSDKKVQRQCVYCALLKKKKRSIYSCDVCQLTLCVVPCFKLYHTVAALPKNG